MLKLYLFWSWLTGKPLGTKSWRLALYKEIHAYQPQSSVHCGFCCWLCEVRNLPGHLIWCEHIKLLPELYAYKPEGAGAYWFPPSNHEKRKAILAEIIKKMDKSTTHENENTNGNQ